MNNLDITDLKPLLNVETRKLLLAARLSIRGFSDTDKLLRVGLLTFAEATSFTFSIYLNNSEVLSILFFPSVESSIMLHFRVHQREKLAASYIISVLRWKIKLVLYEKVREPYLRRSQPFLVRSYMQTVKLGYS